MRPIDPTETLPHVLVDARFQARQLGGDRCRLELARNLAKSRQGRYSFLAYDDTAPTLRECCDGAVVIETRCRPDRHPRGDLFEHVTLPRLCRRLGADIYHGTFNVLPLRHAAWAMVVTIHDMAVFAHPEAYGRKFAMYGRFLVRRAVSQATRIIAVSEATACEILHYVPRVSCDKITVVHNGVGREFIDAAGLSPQQVASVCARLHIRQPYVLYVGNLEPKKNLPRLIEAFRRLRACTQIPHTLVIVGQPLPKGPGSGISDEVASDSAIHFAGYVSDADLPAVYRGADLLAYPSIYEGFGMPVLEAMAAGVPVLTSSVSSLPEVASEAGLLVDPFSVERISDGLHRALTDAGWRRFAVEAGRRRALVLSWENNAKQVADVYQRLWSEMRP